MRCSACGSTNRRSEQRREQPVQPDEDQPICYAYPELGWRGPLQHKQLLAEKCHLGFARRLQSEQSDGEPAGGRATRQRVAVPTENLIRAGTGAAMR
jgi:hypothetical protein